MKDTTIDQAKQHARQRVWDLLEASGALPSGVHGRIPAFVCAEQAADRLATWPAWQTAKVIKAVPDRAQLPVRARALHEAKLVYMAVPNMADIKPFYRLDPTNLTIPAEQVADSKTAGQIAERVSTDQMQQIDMVVCGSVAVNHTGARLGKGAGYSDIELALLQEAGLITPATPIVTTVHQLQVVDHDLPETDHDFRVDLIVTPDEIIECGPPRRPSGLLWDHLDAHKIASIPALAAHPDAPR